MMQSPHHDRQIDVLFTALSQTTEVQRSLAESMQGMNRSIERMGTAMADLAHTLDTVIQRQDEMAERQKWLQKWQSINENLTSTSMSCWKKSDS